MARRYLFYEMAGDNGFEPLLPDPESGGLPLAESPPTLKS